MSSSQTRSFIQKLCYKRAATVDMTQRGFLQDSKLYHAKLLLRSLNENKCGVPEVRQQKSSPLRKLHVNDDSKVTKTQCHTDCRRKKTKKLSKRTKLKNK